MSTHNIRFCREIRKILCGYPLLSVAMFSEDPYVMIKGGYKLVSILVVYTRLSAGFQL